MKLTVHAKQKDKHPLKETVGSGDDCVGAVKNAPQRHTPASKVTKLASTELLTQSVTVLTTITINLFQLYLFYS